MADDILKLNQSQIEAFLRCPEQWRRIYVEQERIPPAMQFHRGKAVHAGCEHNFRQKVESGTDRPAKEIVEYSVESFKAGIKAEGVWLNVEEQSIGLAKLQNEVEGTVKGLSELYATEVAPAHAPIAVEEKSEIAVTESLSLYGTIDWREDLPAVWDLKTGSASTWTQDYLDTSIQLTMYSLVHVVKFKEIPKEVGVELLIDKKKPERRVLTATRRRADFDSLMNQAQAIEHAIRSGSTFGTYGQKGAWWCSKKFCGFWSSCPFVPAHRR